MTDHAAVAGEHEHGEDHHDVHHDDDHDSPDHIRKEIRVYLTVFAGLAVLTIVTVAAAYKLHLPVKSAIMLALAIASVKGFLVAGYFMHLLSEKKLVYGILLITVFFFAVLLWGPWHHHVDHFNH